MHIIQNKVFWTEVNASKKLFCFIQCNDPVNINLISYHSRKLENPVSKRICASLSATMEGNVIFLPFSSLSIIMLAL